MSGPGPADLDAFVVVGRLGRPHGTRGELTVEVRTDDPETRYADGARLLRAAGPPLVVAAHRWHNGRLLLTLVGVGDRTGAEALRDTLLYVDPAADPPLADPDEFYDHQLVGLSAELADGSRLGEVVAALHPPGTDLLAVRRPDGTELLLPFVAQVVPEVDLVGRRLIVCPPPGLLEGPDPG